LIFIKIFRRFCGIFIEKTIFEEFEQICNQSYEEKEIQNNDFLIFSQQNWVFAANTNFLIAISMQPNVVNHWNFKLRLFDQTKCIVWNIKGCRDIGNRKLEFVTKTLFLF